MSNYLELLRDVIDYGFEGDNRTGVNTRSMVNMHYRHWMPRGFPLTTTRKISFKAVIAETLFFLKGHTNTNDLDATFWDPWSREDGELGPIYGAQWRNFCGVDQIENLIRGIKERPNSRRHIVSAWNPSVLPMEDLPHRVNIDLGNQVLPPCHMMFQVIIQGRHAHLIMTQRSADVPVGLPHNIASYGLILELICNTTGYTPGRLCINIGNAHVYVNQIEAVEEQLSRTPGQLPTIHIKNKRDNLWDYCTDDIELIGYNPHPAIKMEVAV